MTSFRVALLAALLAVAPAIAHADEDRSAGVTRAFSAIYFCPSTGNAWGHCPGFTIDHWVPLCAGGEDSFANLWWEETERSFAKERYEVALCRALDHVHQPGDPAEAETWHRYWEAVAAIGDEEAMRVQLDQEKGSE